MPPSTTSTKNAQAIYSVPTSLAKAPSEVTPYWPTVNASAPKAPMGAKRIR